MKYLRAYIEGVKDGWREPFDLSTSWNPEHLVGDNDKWDVYEVHDQGINLGQFLRAGRAAQSYKEFGFPRRPGGPR